VRSVSKWLGPDLRLAVLVGDAATVSRVEGRQSLGTGWVSHLLQGAVAQLWGDAGTAELLERATRRYAARRRALRQALAGHGIANTGRSGLTTWVPVTDELGVTAGLLQQGWAVVAGERFRTASPPGVRIACATLTEAEAPSLAAALARCLEQRPVRSA
jgi:DNA-binding transcriptional MocR family regulator